MLVSKKLLASGIGFQPVEFEISGKTTAIFPDPREQFSGTRRLLDFEVTGSGDFDFYIIPFLQIERFHHRRGQADGETVAPFGDLHSTSGEMIYSKIVYPSVRGGKSAPGDEAD